MQNSGSKHRRRLFLIAFALVAAPLQAGAGFPITAIVHTGEPIPGDTKGDTFTYFGTPSINVNGVIAFRSQSLHFGEFTGAPGLIKRVAVQDDPAPGLPSPGTFSIVDTNFPINALGEVAFSSSYADGRGAWSNVGGVLQNIVAVGDPLPGHPTGGTFSSFGTNLNPILLTDTGLSAYNAWTSTYPNTAEWGIWEGNSKGTTIKVALADDPVPTLAANTFFDSVDYPVINSSGVLAFHGTIKGSGVGIKDWDLIWTGSAGNLQPVARSNDPAPGTTSLFLTFKTPDISSSGKVAFHASLDSSAPVSQRDGIWAGTAGNLTLVARSGLTAPGTGGATFLGTFTDPLVNASGTVSFTDKLTIGTGVTLNNNAGLWTGRNINDLTLVARTGDHAPGTPDGVTFYHSSDFAHVLNNLGQIAFTASLVGSGVTGANDNGLWLYDPIRGTQLIAREGDSLEVSAGVSKTIASIALRTGASSGDGRATSLNDNGQLAFTAGFANEIYYAQFVANIGPAIPGDANQDGTVDVKDLAVLIAHYGQSGTLATGDFNGDTQVNFVDFQVLELNFGRSNIVTASATAVEGSSVPEPGMIAAVLALIAAPIFRRRRS